MILQNVSETKSEWKTKSLKFCDSKIDVTAFLVWFIENYPQSAAVMRDNPSYQFNFK